MEFWLSCRQQYPVLAKTTIKFLIPFVRTYNNRVFNTVFRKKKKQVQLGLIIKLTSFAHLSFKKEFDFVKLFNM